MDHSWFALFAASFASIKEGHRHAARPNSLESDLQAFSDSRTLVCLCLRAGAFGFPCDAKWYSMPVAPPSRHYLLCLIVALE